MEDPMMMLVIVVVVDVPIEELTALARYEYFC
jgi:hypothetical protein